MRSEQEWLALLDKHVRYDNGLLYWKIPARGRRLGHPIGTRAGRHGEIYLDGLSLGTHRVVWLIHKGYLPAMLDHIDRDPTNNKLENLRICTHSENNRNKLVTRRNTSGHKFISFESARNRWVCCITVDGVSHKRHSVDLAKLIAWRDAIIPLVHGEFIPKVNEIRIDKETPDE